MTQATYIYLVTVATHIGYLFHFLSNTMYSSKHAITFRLFPVVTVGTGASYVGELHGIIMLVTFTMDQIIDTLLITSRLFHVGSRHWIQIIFKRKAVYTFKNCHSAMGCAERGSGSQ